MYFTKSSLIIVLSLASLAMTSCSNSSSGGGSTSKPSNKSLDAVKEISSSFSIVRNAGQNQSKNQNPVIAIGNTLRSSLQIDEKIKTVELQKMMEPQFCQFELSDSAGGGSQPAQPQPVPPQPAGTNISFLLKIFGNECPVEAQFYSDIKTVNQRTDIEVNFSFLSKNAETTKVIGAEKASMMGVASIVPSADQSSISGQGTIQGQVEGTRFGIVRLKMLLSGTISGLQTQNVTGSQKIETQFVFEDSSLNLTLTQVFSVQHQKQTVTYFANGSSITAEEYSKILSGIGPVENEQQTGNSQPIDDGDGPKM